MGYNTIGGARGACILSSRSWPETNVSLSFTTCTGSICPSSQAISLFINLPGVVMNFIWRVSRAPKGLCLHFCLLHLFIFPYTVILPLLYFNLHVTLEIPPRSPVTIFSPSESPIWFYQLLPARRLSLYFLVWNSPNMSDTSLRTLEGLAGTQYEWTWRTAPGNMDPIHKPFFFFFFANFFPSWKTWQEIIKNLDTLHLHCLKTKIKTLYLNNTVTLCVGDHLQRVSEMLYVV